MLVRLVQSQKNLTDWESRIRSQLSRGRVGKWGYLAHPRLDDFHWSRLLSLCKAEGQKVWYCMENSEPVLLFGLAHHSTHSDLFDFPVGRVAPLVLLSSSLENTLAALKHLPSKAKLMGFRLVSLRISTDDHLLNFVLSAHGWNHVGTSMKLAIERDSWLDRCRQSGNPTVYESYLSHISDSVHIRTAVKSDIPDLSRIIVAAHRHSHFFNDPLLPETARTTLFPDWIAKSVNGSMDLVLVACQEDRPIGFASCLVSKGLKSFLDHEVGVLDFVAVDPDIQGKGIGKRLLNASYAWLFERCPVVELRTMADNIPALRAYCRLGLIPAATDHHYHYWLRS